MKRVSITQRLTLLLFALTLASLALADGPPPHAQGEPPPFNQEDCVFERGRTVCEVVQTAGVKEVQWTRGFRTQIQCPTGGTVYEIRQLALVSVESIRAVYYGNSDIVESYDVFTDWIEEETVLSSMCR